MIPQPGDGHEPEPLRILICGTCGYALYLDDQGRYVHHEDAADGGLQQAMGEARDTVARNA